jgi:hypothetical protein
VKLASDQVRQNGEQRYPPHRQPIPQAVVSQSKKDDASGLKELLLVFNLKVLKRIK